MTKLPALSQPLFTVTIPSNGKEVLFRPFLVKEEKILLIALQSGSNSDFVRAIKQILTLCIQDEDLVVNNLTMFDLEYLFLKLRSKSVNNVSTVAYRDSEDGEIYTFNIDLDAIEMEVDRSKDTKIKINDEVGMIMKYPSADLADKIRDFTDEIEAMTFFIANCIDTIYDTNEIYLAKDFSEEELTAFIDRLDLPTFEKIKDFFDGIPRLTHKIEYKNKLGNDREIELNNLKDFFTWG